MCISIVHIVSASGSTYTMNPVSKIYRLYHTSTKNIKTPLDIVVLVKFAVCY